MPGHTLNLQRNLCTACGLTAMQIVQSGTMACLGVPGRPPARLVEAAALTAFKNEDAFRYAVEELAGLCGYEHYHTRDSRGSDGGFPDDVFCDGKRTLFVEFKVGRNKPTIGQQLWLKLLKDAGNEVYLWYPEDWDQIVKTFRGE